MGSGLCWELQRDMSVSSRLFEVCGRAGICSYREVKSALQSLQENGDLGWDGGSSRKAAWSWPDKAEHQRGDSEPTSCRSHMQSEFGIFLVSCWCKRNIWKLFKGQISYTICFRPMDFNNVFFKKNGIAVVISIKYDFDLVCRHLIVLR